MGSTTFSGPVTSEDGFVGNLTGNVTGNVGGVGVATVNGYGATAGGSQTAANTVSRMNNNGLVVIDGSGVKRVKIGNLSSL